MCDNRTGAPTHARHAAASGEREDFLSPASGSFTQTCHDCRGDVNSVDGGFMICQCNSGKYETTNIHNLAQCTRLKDSPQVDNTNGSLTCMKRASRAFPNHQVEEVGGRGTPAVVSSFCMYITIAKGVGGALGATGNLMSALKTSTTFRIVNYNGVIGAYSPYLKITNIIIPRKEQPQQCEFHFTPPCLMVPYVPTTFEVMPIAD